MPYYYSRLACVLLAAMALLVQGACLSVRAHDGVRMSPMYFGPNALPVPPMTDVPGQERRFGALAYDLHCGFYGDMTHTLFAQVRMPLFSDRVSLNAWMQVVEYYVNTDASIMHQEPRCPSYRGWQPGNLYLAADVHAVRERRFVPDVVLRAALVTASGDGDQYARYYDAPGYFFDATAAKSFALRGSVLKELRLLATAGFLCWQVEKYVQNDAYMYGLEVKAGLSFMDMSLSWQGYTGWVGDGDRPMVVRTGCMFRAGRFRPLVEYEYGIRDYPFHHLRIGAGYVF